MHDELSDSEESGLQGNIESPHKSLDKPAAKRVIKANEATRPKFNRTRSEQSTGSRNYREGNIPADTIRLRSAETADGAHNRILSVFRNAYVWDSHVRILSLDGLSMYSDVLSDTHLTELVDSIELIASDKRKNTQLLLWAPDLTGPVSDPISRLIDDCMSRNIVAGWGASQYGLDLRVVATQTGRSEVKAFVSTLSTNPARGCIVVDNEGGSPAFMVSSAYRVVSAYVESFESVYSRLPRVVVYGSDVAGGIGGRVANWVENVGQRIMSGIFVRNPAYRPPLPKYRFGSVSARGLAKERAL
jgi:hypothetical protein